MGPALLAQLAAIAESANAVGHGADLERLLAQIADAASSLRPEAACVVRLLDGPGGAERIVAAAGIDAADMVSHDTPIEIGMLALGTLALRLPASAPPLAVDDEGLLRLLAAQAAAAIRNAQLGDDRRRLGQASRALVQDLGAIVWEADPATLRVSFVSHRAETILGYPLQRWLGDPEFLTAMVHPDDRERVAAVRRAAASAVEGQEVEYRATTADGRVLWLRDLLHVVPDPSDRRRRLLGLMVNITERKQLEDQLRQSQKMDAIGRLAGGIAHDFNNLLMVIEGRAELLLDQMEADHPLRRHADLVLETAQRASKLTEQLLAFSRPRGLEPTLCDLNAIVRRMRSMLQPLIGEHVQLHLAAGPGAAPVIVDAGHMEQAILNLVVNARDAITGPGRVIIETSEVQLDASVALTHPGTEPGPYVRLTVSDSGCGMDSRTQGQIFEPFFTTKKRGHGTGLGLSIVYGVVRNHGGFIVVDSAPGEGSTFSIYLPRATGTDLATAGDAAGGPLGLETLLLVEDEGAVRDVAREILERSGYRVLAAGSAEEALALSQGHIGAIDLLLTDVVLPTGDGPTLARHILQRHPQVKIMYMSGYGRDVLDPAEPERLVLQKPVSRDTLLRTVREALDAAPIAKGRAI